TAVPVRDPSGRMTRFERLIVRKDDRTDIVLFWYETRTGRLVSDIDLKGNLMRTALLHQPQGTAFVPWSTAPHEGDGGRPAAERLMASIAVAWPALETALPFKI